MAQYILYKNHVIQKIKKHTHTEVLITTMVINYICTYILLMFLGEHQDNSMEEGGGKDSD